MPEVSGQGGYVVALDQHDIRHVVDNALCCGIGYGADTVILGSASRCRLKDDLINLGVSRCGQVRTNGEGQSLGAAGNGDGDGG